MMLPRILRHARRSGVRLALALSIVFAGAPATALPIDIAVNGSFEFDDIAPNTIGTLLAPVTGWDTVPLLIDGEPSAAFPNGGSTGSQYADCGNNPSSGCEQSFSVASGFELVEITWNSNNATVGLPSTPYTVEVRDVLDSIVAMGTYLAPSHDLIWTAADLDTSTLSLGAGAYKVVIFGTAGLGSNDVFIDDVGIMIEAIPEPGTAVLLSLGLAGLGLRRREAAVR